MKPSIITSNKEREILWDQYVSIVFPDGITDQDCIVFSQFITLLHTYNIALDELDKNGHFYESTDSSGKLLIKSNPAHKTINDVGRALIAFYNRYGLTEWDRNKNKKIFKELEEKEEDDDFSDIDD